MNVLMALLSLEAFCTNFLTALLSMKAFCMNFMMAFLTSFLRAMTFLEAFCMNFLMALLSMESAHRSVLSSRRHPTGLLAVKEVVADRMGLAKPRPHGVNPSSEFGHALDEGLHHLHMLTVRVGNVDMDVAQLSVNLSEPVIKGSPHCMHTPIKILELLVEALSRRKQVAEESLRHLDRWGLRAVSRRYRRWRTRIHVFGQRLAEINFLARWQGRRMPWHFWLRLIGSRGVWSSATMRGPHGASWRRDVKGHVPGWRWLKGRGRQLTTRASVAVLLLWLQGPEAGSVGPGIGVVGSAPRNSHVDRACSPLQPEPLLTEFSKLSYCCSESLQREHNLRRMACLSGRTALLGSARGLSTVAVSRAARASRLLGMNLLFGAGLGTTVVIPGTAAGGGGGVSA